LVPVLGATLLVAAGDLGGFPSAGHVAAAAGLVPVPNDSGRRSGNLHKPRRYSRPLRHVFYLSAQTSMMREGPNRDYYLKRRQQARTHTQATIALARRAAWRRAELHRDPTPSHQSGLTTTLRFPVSGDQPVIGLGGPRRDVDYVRQHAALTVRALAWTGV
jgi:hypothetical protein